MRVLITNTFKRATKKMHRQQILELEQAIAKIQSETRSGDLKVGDLDGVRVYKFRMSGQLVLLAYTYDEQNDELTLLSVASHENFYKDLKKQLNT